MRLRAAGIENDVHIYDHVNHGFWLHIRPRPGNQHLEPAQGRVAKAESLF